MTVYYQEIATERTVASQMTKLSNMGYTIHSVLPNISIGSTTYIIVYFR